MYTKHKPARVLTWVKDLDVLETLYCRLKQTFANLIGTEASN